MVLGIEELEGPEAHRKEKRSQEELEKREEREIARG